MLRASFSGSETSAALVALPVSVYLLWQRRSAIELNERGNLAGAIVLVVGVMMFTIGEVWNVRLLSQMGAVTICFGVFASALSARGLRQLFPVALTLLFVVELPGLFSKYVSLPLAKLNASLAARSIEQFGCAVDLQGTIVTTDHAQLQVVDACDGLRFFWVVLLISFAMCVTKRVSLKAMLLVLAITPLIALALNTVRISSVAMAFQAFPHEAAEQFHDVSAWVMMGGACIIPKVLMNWLPVRHVPTPDWLVANVPKRYVFTHPITPTTWFCLGMPIAMVLGVALVQKSDPEPLPVAWIDHALKNVSYRLGHYVAEDVGIPDRQLAVLRPDTLLSRRYRSLNDDRDFLLIVSFHLDGAAHSGHSVDSCYGAIGWNVEELNEPFQTDPLARLGVQSFRLTRDRSAAHAARQELIIHSLTVGAGSPRRGQSKASIRAELLRLQLVFHPGISRSTRRQLTELAVQELGAPLARLGVADSVTEQGAELESVSPSDSVCERDSQNAAGVFQIETEPSCEGPHSVRHDTCFICERSRTRFPRRQINVFEFKHKKEKRSQRLEMELGAGTWNRSRLRWRLFSLSVAGRFC